MTPSIPRPARAAWSSSPRPAGFCSQARSTSSTWLPVWAIDVARPTAELVVPLPGPTPVRATENSPAASRLSITARMDWIDCTSEPGEASVTPASRSAKGSTTGTAVISGSDEPTRPPARSRRTFASVRKPRVSRHGNMPAPNRPATTARSARLSRHGPTVTGGRPACLSGNAGSSRRRMPPGSSWASVAALPAASASAAARSAAACRCARTRGRNVSSVCRCRSDCCRA